jgi:hypothetical protein
MRLRRRRVRVRMAQRGGYERWRGGVEGEAGVWKELLPVSVDVKFGGMP